MKNDGIFAPLRSVARTFDAHAIPHTIAALREVAQSAIERANLRKSASPITTPLKHITMVGALKEDDCFNCLDFHILTDGLRHLLEAGFLIAPDFEIDIVNFVYGRDFLAEDTATDIVLGCHLFDSNRHPPFADPESYKRRFNRAISAIREDEMPEQGGMIFDKYEGSTILSPLTYDKDAWYERIQRAGAKIVINDRTELEISRFLGEGFSVLSNNQSRRSGFPYNEYQYAFNDAFILKSYPHLNPFSALARDIDKSARSDMHIIDRAWNRRIQRPALIPNI